MKKYIINDLASLEKYAKTIKNPIIAVGARPFNLTIGVYDLFNHFEVLACRRSTKEASLLEEKIKITYLNAKKEFKNTKNFKTYIPHMPKDIFKNKEIMDYLEAYREKPALLFFRMSEELENILKNKKVIPVGTDFRMYDKYENKLNFQKLLEQLKISTPKFIKEKAANLNYAKLKKELGDKFVVQLPVTALGAGTFFIFEKTDFEKMLKKENIKKAIAKNVDTKIARYIEMSCSPSMTVCVTKFGILHTNLQNQIIDAKEVLEKGRRSGVFCGHDWNKIFKKEIEDQAIKIAEKIGTYLKEKENFEGIFGLDFVLEKETNKLYPIEANVRLLGSFPILPMVQKNANQPSIQGLQIIESLNKKDYVLDIQALNTLMHQPKSGAHLNIHARNKQPVYVSGSIKPGIYNIDVKNNKVSYARKGIFFNDLKKPNEILLVNVPYKNRVFEQHNALCKIITKSTFLNDNDKLNKLAKSMVNYAYKKLALKAI
ncbi:MAG: hypothetical protein WAV31_00210 [Candidatus Moraniibacteriota bacterium]